MALIRGDAPPPAQSGSADLLFVLLILQAGAGFTSALGMAFFAALSRSPRIFGGPVLFAFAVPALVTVLAFAVARGRRWARIGAATFEALILLASAFRFLLRSGPSFGLAGLIVAIAVPAAVLALVLAPHVSRIVHARRMRIPEPRPAAPGIRKAA